MGQLLVRFQFISSLRVSVPGRRLFPIVGVRSRQLVVAVFRALLFLLLPPPPPPPLLLLLLLLLLPQAGYRRMGEAASLNALVLCSSLEFIKQKIKNRTKNLSRLCTKSIEFSSGFFLESFEEGNVLGRYFKKLVSYQDS